MNWLLFALAQFQIVMLGIGLAMLPQKEKRHMAYALLIIGLGGVVNVFVLDGTLSGPTGSIAASASITLAALVLVRHGRQRREV